MGWFESRRRLHAAHHFTRRAQAQARRPIMSDDNEISYEGIDEADLVLGLYRGTRALGMGHLHNAPALTVEQVREDIAAMQPCGEFAPPQDIPGGTGDNTGGILRFDYYRGRPLKCSLDTERKVLRGVRLYDRDAGHGAAAAVIDSLRRKAA
jgi:hypothetical protein